MNAACLTLALSMTFTGSGVAPEPAPGHRTALGIEGAAMFVPEGCKPGPGGVVDVVLHLHGASTVVEPALIDSHWPSAVLITFNRKGLSRVYAEPFSDRTLLPRLLDAARSALKTHARRRRSADRPAGRQLVQRGVRRGSWRCSRTPSTSPGSTD